MLTSASKKLLHHLKLSRDAQESLDDFLDIVEDNKELSLLVDDRDVDKEASAIFIDIQLRLAEIKGWSPPPSTPARAPVPDAVRARGGGTMKRGRGAWSTRGGSSKRGRGGGSLARPAPKAQEREGSHDESDSPSQENRAGTSAQGAEEVEVSE